MKAFCIVLLIALVITGCSHSYYVVRHAEKGSSATNPSDPPLSSEGEKRAEALKEELKRNKIQKIFATSTQRAMATARPLGVAAGVLIENYGPLPTQEFLQQLKAQKKNVLIVGHSNTVDDIVNGLSGKIELQDLPDTEYDNLYIITYKGKNVKVQKKKYGR